MIPNLIFVPSILFVFGGLLFFLKIKPKYVRNIMFFTVLLYTLLCLYYAYFNSSSMVSLCALLALFGGLWFDMAKKQEID